MIFWIACWCPKKQHLLAGHVHSVSKVTPLVPQSGIFTTEMRGVNRWKRGASETTTVTDMDEVDQQGWHWLLGPAAAALLPSLPLVWPSWCQSWVQYKASSVGEGENTMLSPLPPFWKAVWWYFLWEIQHENWTCYVRYLRWPYCIALQDWSLRFCKDANE